MKVALVHDWMNQTGGAEDVLEVMVEIFPDAPIYTSLYAPDKMPHHWQDWDIRTSFIDWLPFSHRRQQLYFPLYPMAMEQFDLREYDLVLSNKSGFCHGVITGEETVHICYCLTPTRYVWRYQQYAEQEKISRPVRLALQPFLKGLRQWDKLAADRVDDFIAISEAVRRRIAKIYRRDSDIIHPPVNVHRFEPSARVEDYYLFVGRLVPYRRIDLLVEAFNKMNRPLFIAGTGRDRSRLEDMASPNVTFLGYVPGEDLPGLFARARAFVFPGEEDFGIAPIQAMAAGRPVIAYAAGGALETVTPGTGKLFAEQSVAAIIQTVEEFDPDSVDIANLRRHAQQYDAELFKSKLIGFIQRKLNEKLSN
jgi:glycosyltransferase involved in cell wall biosynthesis